MTGGVPALALLVGAAIIFALRARTLLFRQIVDSLELRTAKLGMVIIILSAIASLVDYPLRVPSFACLFVVAIIWMSCPLPKNPPSPRPL
jgi:hypothetical protein